MQLQPTGSGLLSIVGTHGASVVVVLVVVVILDETTNEKHYINPMHFTPKSIYNRERDKCESQITYGY